MASADALASTVQRLGEELAGLYSARRSRSVIEQAKGVLMARLHCSAQQAFDQLVQISQQTNTKVAEVAAGLLGLTSPVVTDRESSTSVPLPTDRDELGNDRAASRPVLPDQDAARYYLTCAAMSAARDGDAIAEALLVDGLQQLGVTTVLLAVLESDGAIRLAGSHGLPRGVVSAWRRVSGSLNVGYLRAAADGRVLWLNRTEAMSSGLELLGEGDFRVCLPLRRGARVFGVASFIWAEEPDLDLTRRAYVMALGDAAGRRLAQLDTHDDDAVASPSAHWLEAVLQAMPEPVALLCPITDAWGTVVDWRFDKCSPDAFDAAGRSPEQLLGRRLLELYPHLAGSEILRGYEAVLRTGRPFTYSSTEQLLSIARAAAAPFVVHAAKFGEGILLAWQSDHERQLLDRIERLEHAVGAGWLEWDLQRGETTWAAATAAILGVQQAPAEPADLRGCVRAEDAPTVDAAVRQAMRDGQPADVTVRLRGSDPPPKVRIVIKPISEGRGRIIAVSAAVRVCSGPGDSDRPGGPQATHRLGDSYPSAAPPRREGLAAHEGPRRRRRRS